MLAVVKMPQLKISIHGDGSARILGVSQQQFQIEVLAADDDETLVNIRDSVILENRGYSGTASSGFRLKHGLIKTSWRKNPVFRR